MTQGRRLTQGLGVALWLLGPGVAAAEQSSAPQSEWEIQVHGGAVLATTPSEGTAALPALASPVGVNGSRTVPSWYFGDGAAQLNRLARARLVPQIVSLDPVLGSRFVRRQSGWTAGIRVARVLTRRLTAEFNVDYSLGRLALTDESATAIQAARASFVAAWDGVLTNPFFIGTRLVTSEATVSDRQGREVVTTGTLLVNLAPAARLAPYVALGAGLMSHIDTPPSAVIAGAYQFTLAAGPTAGLRQTDTVTVRSSIDSGSVWVLGGGVKYAMSERLGFRFDVRDHLHRSRASTLVDALPTSTSTSTTQFSLGFFAPPGPPLVFSVVPTIPSTLGVAPLVRFTTFTGGGTAHRVNVTTGVYWRF